MTTVLLLVALALALTAGWALIQLAEAGSGGPPAPAGGDLMVLEHSPVGALLLDPALRVTWANDTFCRFFGLTRAEVVGQKMPDLIQTHLKVRRGGACGVRVRSPDRLRPGRRRHDARDPHNPAGHPATPVARAREPRNPKGPIGGKPDRVLRERDTPQARPRYISKPRCIAARSSTRPSSTWPDGARCARGIGMGRSARCRGLP